MTIFLSAFSDLQEALILKRTEYQALFFFVFSLLPHDLLWTCTDFASGCLAIELRVLFGMAHLGIWRGNGGHCTRDLSSWWRGTCACSLLLVALQVSNFEQQK